MNNPLIDLRDLKQQADQTRDLALENISLPSLSGAWRGVAILTLGLALGSAAGCAPARPTGIKDQDLSAFKAEGEQYQKTYPNDGTAGGLIYLAHLITGREIADLNQIYRNSSGTSEAGGAHQTFLSAVTNKPISEITDMYSRSTSSGAHICNNLVLASILSDSSIEKINGVFKSTSSWSAEAGAPLTLAQVISNRPIAEINELYSKSKPSTGAGALLVLASVLTNRSIENLNQDYSNSQVWNERVGAMLTLLASVHDRKIEDVYKLYSECDIKGVSGINLVQAALISNRPMVEINYLYSQANAKRSDGGALIVLGNVIKEVSQKSNGLRCLPLLIGEPSGKTTACRSIPLILPGRVAEGVGFPINR